jgi:hypothetical protein
LIEAFRYLACLQWQLGGFQVFEHVFQPESIDKFANLHPYLKKVIDALRKVSFLTTEDDGLEYPDCGEIEEVPYE